MKIRTIFGCLFFLLSVAFCAFQLITLITSERMSATPLLLQFSTALVCLLLGSLAVQSGSKAATLVVSVVAFSVCFLALVCAGFLTMKSGVLSGHSGSFTEDSGWMFSASSPSKTACRFDSSNSTSDGAHRRRVRPNIDGLREHCRSLPSKSSSLRRESACFGLPSRFLGTPVDGVRGHSRPSRPTRRFA